MKKPIVLVIIDRGCVSEVLSNTKNIQVHVEDLDAEFHSSKEDRKEQTAKRLGVDKAIW